MTLSDLKRQCIAGNIVPVPAEVLGELVACVEAADVMAKMGAPQLPTCLCKDCMNLRLYTEPRSRLDRALGSTPMTLSAKLDELRALCDGAAPHWHEVSFDPGFYWDGNPDNATEQPRPPAVFAEGGSLAVTVNHDLGTGHAVVLQCRVVFD